MKIFNSKTVSKPLKLLFCSIFVFSITVFLILIIDSGCSQIKGEKNAVKIAGSNLPRPAWVSEYPIVFFGNWDAMPIFRRRVGGNPVWQEDVLLQTAY